mmetsp:Transcript_3779/g.10801  ORF Transcript_3779/g.10801 Transcript_3779/m.10801 type:complete len:204 (-) Transcript_3779:251-862(-)
MSSTLRSIHSVAPLNNPSNTCLSMTSHSLRELSASHASPHRCRAPNHEKSTRVGACPVPRSRSSPGMYVTNVAIEHGSSSGARSPSSRATPCRMRMASPVSTIVSLPQSSLPPPDHPSEYRSTPLPRSTNRNSYTSPSPPPSKRGGGARHVSSCSSIPATNGTPTLHPPTLSGSSSGTTRLSPPRVGQESTRVCPNELKEDVG